LTSGVFSYPLYISYFIHEFASANQISRANTDTHFFWRQKSLRIAPGMATIVPRERKDFDPFQIASKIMDSKQAWLFHDI